MDELCRRRDPDRKRHGLLQGRRHLRQRVRCGQPHGQQHRQDRAREADRGRERDRADERQRERDRHLRGGFGAERILDGRRELGSVSGPGQVRQQRHGLFPLHRRGRKHLRGRNLRRDEHRQGAAREADGLGRHYDHDQRQRDRDRRLQRRFREEGILARRPRVAGLHRAARVQRERQGVLPRRGRRRESVRHHQLLGHEHPAGHPGQRAGRR